MLEGEKVEKYFGGTGALRNVSFYVKEKEIVGLIGPNGAGKTTLFNLITGTYKPTAGRIRYNGIDITRKLPQEIAKMGIARTYQIVRPFLNMSCVDNVTIGALFGNQARERKGLKAAKELATKTLDYVGIPKKDWETPTRSLNIAERKRVDLARSIAEEPNLLLIDEIAAGLNPKEKEGIISLITIIRDSKGITVFVVEHDMYTIMTACGRIVVLNFGEKIAEGTPDEVAKNSRVIEAYLGESYAKGK